MDSGLAAHLNAATIEVVTAYLVGSNSHGLKVAQCTGSVQSFGSLEMFGIFEGPLPGQEQV